MKIKRAREILDRFRGRQVLVLGDCMLDHWLWGSVTRISPEAPVPVVDVERSTYTPGGAANVVHNLCGLGAQTGMVGVVGKDDAGRRLRAMLRDQGAHVDGLVIDSHRPTTTKTRIIAHSQQVVRADSELRDHVNGRVSERMLAALDRHLAECEGLLISDYSKGVISEALLRPVLEHARKQGKLVVAGPKPENLDLFKGVTVLALNEREAQAASGRKTDQEAGAEAAAHDLLRRMGCSAVLLTRGHRGMCLVEKGKKAHHVPTYARQVYDVSGAGDTVVSVLTLALAAGATMLEATTLANFAAAVVVQKVGTATASADEILGAMRDHY